nr:uncharacterized protein LOC111509830 [Leptinotarsa decemlineata]
MRFFKKLGLIVAGEIENPVATRLITCHLGLHAEQFDSDLTRFWEIEEIPSSKLSSPEEKACEVHYSLHTTRDKSGRYVVRLPFNDKIQNFGESYSTALCRFYALERRFQKDPDLQHQYSDFLIEYQKLGNMSRISGQDDTARGFYLPHHAVRKDDSLTTKIRVVFDCSAKTSTGISLNDTLMVGPKVQDDLFIILLSYRLHLYALTADVEKMYRQIRVHPDDAIYQTILYRESISDPIETYILEIVTYGTASASHLAIRSLQQLVEDEGHYYPLASVSLKKDFYVDDLLTGAKTLPKAELLRDQLQDLVKKGGFQLRKWASNHPSLISNYSEHPKNTHMCLDPESSVKTLGIHWNSKSDILFY